MSRGEKIVTFDPSRRRPSGARFAELAETAQRLKQERAGAAELVARHLNQTPRDEWPQLAEEPELRSNGALEELAALIRVRCEKDPQEALVLSTLATTIAETLGPGAYPAVTLAQLRAQAWKDRAHTLRYLARYDEAFEAIDMAESALAPFPATAYDKAVVALVKAITLQHVEKFDESRALLAECRVVFQDHGDSRLGLYCGITEVSLLYREEKYDEARDVGVDLLAAASQVEDRESLARLHNNVGYCEIQRGNIRAANAHLANAKAIFVDLGRATEAIRSERGFGSLLVSKGHIAEGISALQTARVELLAGGLVEEAGLCGLTMADAMLRGRNFLAARALVSEIVEQFVRAGFSDRAVRAMQHLSDSIADRSASSATVTHVARYFEVLRTNPFAEFSALHA